MRNGAGLVGTLHVARRVLPAGLEPPSSTRCDWLFREGRTSGERVFHASDVGRAPDLIARDFPGWCVKSLEDTPAWWYTGASGADNLGDDPSVIKMEPPEVFEERMTALKAWIAGRDESVIAMVAHWGVWYSLTGREFENCELVTCDLADLEPGAGKMPL